MSSIAALGDEERFAIDDSPRARGYFVQQTPIRVDQRLLEQLKMVHAELGDRNVRLCLHSSPDAPHHEMLIVEKKGRYYRPHRHEDKGETFHIVEGRLGVFSFADDGEVVDACILEAKGCFIYKVRPSMHHAVMPLTDIVIYFETKPGPFKGASDSIFPDWAPDGSDDSEVLTYLEALRRYLDDAERGTHVDV